MAHAVAVRFDQLVLPPRQFEHLEQLVNSFFDDLAVLPIETGHELEELGSGQLFVEERAVGDESQSRFGCHGIGDYVVTAEPYAPRGGPHDSGDDAQGRRFSGAVRPNKAKHRSTRHMKIDVVHGHELPVRLGKALQPNHGLLL